MTIPSQNLKNNFYFKKILHYCSKGIRSEYEVWKKLSSFENADEELRKDILLYFLKIKVIYSDEDFIDYYLDNLSATKGFTFNQLYLKLDKKIRNKSILKNKLSLFLNNTADLQIQRFIERNLRKIASREPGPKRVGYLIQKGFKVDLILRYLPKYNL